MSVAADTRAPAERRGARLRTAVLRGRSGPWTPRATAITVVTGLLLLMGLVMSFSASVVDAAEGGDPFGILRRQVAWAAIGVPVFLVVSATDHRVWRRLSWILLAVAFVGLVAVLVPGVGLTRGGATRWIGLGPFVVQPSEIAKLATLLWLADVLERKRPRDGGPFEVQHLLVPALPLLGIFGMLILLEPDLGTTVLLGIIVALVLFLEGLPMRLFAAVGAAGAAIVALAAAVAPYRMARITGWLDPEADPTGKGYQLLQSLFALGSGGWFGLGLGSSRGKWNFVPNPETDFVFAIIGEELGLVGALVVLSLFGALLVLGLRVARQATGFARTVAFGITAWLVGQAAINVATVVGALPITGMTLPLVSAGGSSLVSTLVGLGILVAIARSQDSRGHA
jgi:cell division protein FtsW